MGVVNIKPPAGAAIRAQALPPLNRDQEKALAAAQAVLFGRRGRFLIKGKAGTGKTRAIIELVRRWPGRVAVAAPTHKAAAVLHAMLLADPTIDVAIGFTRGATRRQATTVQSDPTELQDLGDVYAALVTAGAGEAAAIGLGDGACPGYGEDDADEDQARVVAGTIHSLLGLQPLEDDHGKERLVPVGESTVEQFSLVIIDESSMIGRALQNEINAISGIPVLYVGDRAQLPPVGETEAPCFLEVKAWAVLAEVVRQQKDNPILQLASALRDQQQAQQAIGIDTAMLHNLPPWRPDQPGVFEATMDDIVAAIHADPDRTRMLAYTNSQTIAHNTSIREAVIGKTPTPFIVGERCLVRSPVITLSKSGERSILIPVNAEPTVIDIRAETIEIAVGGPLRKGRGKVWPARTLRAPVWCLVLLHEGEKITCAIERKHGMRDNWMSYATRAKRWDDRWRIRAALSDIRHTYAITAHTSQGSTFDVVFVDARNILLGGIADRLTRLKLFYTACTRPSLQLGVYWEPQGFV